MFKKTIKWTDLNGVEREEDFYFHFSQSELTEWELSKDGGLSAYIEKIVAAKSVPQLIELFKFLLLHSYGVKSDDGRRFIKTPEVVAEFSQTEAFSQLFMELVTDTTAATAFINGIIPKITVGAEKK